MVLLFFILLMVSFAGYGMFLLFKFNINTSFIPALIVSTITVVLFIAGLLNILVFATYIIFFLGLIIFLTMLIKIYKSKLSLIQLWSPGILFFTFLVFIFVLLLHNSMLTYYDNFSHWGLIVKEMITKDTLPDDSTIITYRNYPPGTAIFIYYVVKIIGFSESMALIAQSLLTASFLTSLFAFSSWKRPLSLLLPTIASFCALLVLPYSLNSLVVDNILGYVSIAAFTIVFYYRNNISFLSHLSTPLLSMIILTKDSGKIFFSFLVIWIIILLIKKLFTNKNFSWKVLTQTLFFVVAVPLFINYLWGQYQKKAYSIDYEENRFAITMDIFNIDRSQEFVQNLLPQLLSSAFDLSSPVFLTMILINIWSFLALAFYLFFFKKLLLFLLYNTIYLNLVYILYICFLYILYLFIMPEVEAEYLAGFNRYHASIAIFFIGSMFFVINESWHYTLSLINKHIWIRKTVAIFSLLIIIPLAPGIEELSQSNEDNVRTQLSKQYQALQVNTDVNTSDNITIIKAAEEDDNGYIRHVMNYERLTENTDQFFSCQSTEESKALQDSLAESEYMIVLNMNKRIENCLQEFSDHTNYSRGIYSIDQSNIKPIEVN